MIVPKSLRAWFVIHSIIDLIFAIPLIFFPIEFFRIWGIEILQPLLSQIIGAALVGIGGASYLSRNKNLEVFNEMLNLKILWSLTVILVVLFSLFNQIKLFILIILLIFILFSSVWIYYKFKVYKK